MSRNPCYDDSNKELAGQTPRRSGARCHPSATVRRHVKSAQQDGQNVPDVGFRIRKDYDSKTVASAELLNSILVKDGVVEKLFVEPRPLGDPIEVSDADTMLHYINPRALASDRVVVFIRENRQFRAQAKSLSRDVGLRYVDVPIAHQRRSLVAGPMVGL